MMKILDKYIYKKTLMYFLIVFPSFAIISGLVELIEILRKVKDIDIWLITIYILSKIPENSYYIIPASVLVSVFIVIMELKKSKEIYPILTNGISVKYLNIRFLIFSIVVCLIQFINLQLIMPKTVPLTQKIYMKLKNASEENQKTIAYNTWLKIDENKFIYFEVYDTNSKTGKGLLILEFDKDLKPLKRIESQEFKLIDKKLYVKNYRLIYIKSLNEVIIENIEGLKEINAGIDSKEIEKLIKEKKPISLTDIYKIATISKRYGYEPSYYWSKLFQKVATVISPFVLVIFSVMFFWKNSYYKIFVGFLSILFYWYGISVISSISEAGKLPYISPLIVDMIFILIGSVMILKLKPDFS